ncbi:MAG: HAMP domain-containing methyl-accepting chemotaxis protein [Spirochaetales bacterium]
MSLKTKLFLLVIGSLLMFVLAAGIYFAIQAPIEQMRKENGVFQRLSLAATELRAEANLLATSGFETQVKRFRDSVANFQLALKEMDTVTLLPTVSETLKQAVTAVKDLGSLSADGLEQVAGNLADLEADAKELYQGVSDDFIVVNLLKNTDDTSGLAMFHTGSLLNNLTNLNDLFVTTVKVIKEKDAVIFGEVSALQSRATWISLGAVILLLVVTLTLSLSLTRSITLSFRAVDKNITLMSAGDFTQRLRLKRRDEIGILGRKLDDLLDSLNGSLSTIQQASRHNLALREELVRAVTEASSSSVEIEANSSSIRSQMETMDHMIAVSSSDMDNILGALDRFTLAIRNQNSLVEDSVGSVTQVLTSIGNISLLTERDQRSAESLVREADGGREVFNAAFEKVAEITESVGSIQEMADVISGIAGQTQILAMNAAIEAAHAGEFGKGFAVVADEITKLAQAARTSSDDIARVIRTILSKMKEAGSTRETTSQAFEVITRRIGEVSRSVREIHGNVNEMQVGSQHVLEAMSELKSGSLKITEEAVQVLQSSGAVQKVMGEVRRVSQEVVSNIGEIGTGLSDISGTIRQVSEQADGIGVIAGNLDGAIQKFKTA